ncbi:hypothetical protein [Lentzea fradiae]|uniref:hypothetical protein n=1 Tax=Lentzea fradiae TaxID=200378 RepID=UPI000B7CC303|nr:hypothetical protein [Lentzea fradiae]
MDATRLTSQGQWCSDQKFSQKCGSTADTSLDVSGRTAARKRQTTETMKKLPITKPTKRQIAATFTTVVSEQIILIEKFTFSF